MALKAGGFFFLLSGWLIAAAAVALVSGATRGGFVAAGLALEATGLGLVLRGQMATRGRKR